MYANRDQGESLTYLAQQYPQGLIRLGIQPGEPVRPPYIQAVQDTWSGFCHGKTNADWLDRGFGAETLRRWVQKFNQQPGLIVWNLIAVAWDYAPHRAARIPATTTRPKTCRCLRTNGWPWTIAHRGC